MALLVYPRSTQQMSPSITSCPLRQFCQNSALLLLTKNFSYQILSHSHKHCQAEEPSPTNLLPFLSIIYGCFCTLTTEPNRILFLENSYL